MKKPSTAFLEALEHGEPLIGFVEIEVGGEEVAGTHHPDPAKVVFLANTEPPTVSLDLSADIVSTVTSLPLLIPDELVPEDSFSPLSPLNHTTVRLFTGIDHGDEIEKYPTGVFVIDDIQIEDHGDGIMADLALIDRASELERAVFKLPFTVPSGSNIVELIQGWIHDVFPGLTLSAPDIGTPTAALEFKENESRLSAIRTVAAAINHVFYFNEIGEPILQPPPAVDAEAVLHFSVEDDHPGPVPMSLCRKLTRRNVFNGVIVRAESTREPDEEGDTPEPFYAEAWADHIPTPISYTQAEAAVDAPGAFPLITTTQVLTDQDQVNRATREAADLYALQPETVSFMCLPIPGLELGDTIEITHPRLKVTGLFTVGRIDRANGFGLMGVGCDERRIR